VKSTHTFTLLMPLPESVGRLPFHETMIPRINRDFRRLTCDPIMRGSGGFHTLKHHIAPSLTQVKEGCRTRFLMRRSDRLPAAFAQETATIGFLHKKRLIVGSCRILGGAELATPECRCSKPCARRVFDNAMPKSRDGQGFESSTSMRSPVLWKFNHSSISILYTFAQKY
jgi:hypothetical protein